MNRSTQGGSPLDFKGLFLNDEMRVVDPESRDRIVSRFRRLLLPGSESLEYCRQTLKPCVDGMMEMGDMILFMGDAIHAGPAVEGPQGIRHYCFIPLRPDSWPVCNNSQITPLVLAQNLYGAASTMAFETHRLLEKLYPTMKPRLENFCSPTYLDAYQEWQAQAELQEWSLHRLMQ